MSEIMTLKKFRTLKKRDFDNGGMLDAIDRALEDREKQSGAIQRLVEEITDFHRWWNAPCNYGDESDIVERVAAQNAEVAARWQRIADLLHKLRPEPRKT